MTDTSIFKLWTGMHSRCYTPSATGFKNYGGRGIKVCARWHLFELFLADMGTPPPGMSLDRKDSDGDYEPDNCRWATRTEQNRNQRDLRYVVFRGRRQCLSAWAEEIGSTYSTLKARINRGWPLDRVLTAPVRPHKQYERTAAWASQSRG